MTIIGRHPIRPATAYLWFEGSWSLLHRVAFTLLLVYQVQTAHLSPLELIVVGTVMEATCFLAEVPTGIVADLYSRRLSALAGALVVGAGILVQAAFPAFWPIVLGNIIWGIGYTFISGAVDAWITDEVGPDAVQPLFVRFEQQHLALTIVGVVLAGALGHVDLRLPMLVAGLGYVLLALVMSQLMPEHNFTRTPHAGFAHMGRILRDGLNAARRPGVVRSFLVIAVLTGLSSEVFDRLWTARVLASFQLPDLFGIRDPALWFTVFALISTALALIANLAANRFAADRINAVHPAGLMATLVLVQAAGYAGFALLGSLWPVLAAMWVRDAARSIATPISNAWLNRNVESHARATTLSLAAQADAIGQVAGGPPLGLLATRTSIPVAMLAGAVIFTPAAWVFARLRPNGSEAAVHKPGVTSV